MVFVTQLLVFLVNNFLQGLYHLSSCFSHLLGLLLVNLIELVLLRLDSIIHHSILVQVLVSELPFSELLNSGIFLDDFLSGLI